MEKPVSFNSGSDVCKGVLTMPDGASGKVPLIVMAGGWCYTKEIVMPHYAKYFQNIGVATLLFDYRNFGESTGEQRQHIDPWAQIEDYKNALTFAETLEGVDPKRLGIWGISYSGGHVLVTAATDPRVRWVISTIPVVEGFTTLRRCHGERRFAELQQLILSDRRKRPANGGKSEYMPMSSLKPDQELSAWPFPHVCEIFNEIKKREAPRHEHRNTIASVENLLAYNVFPYCQRIIDTPFMMAVAQGDNITSADLEISAFNAVVNPNKTLAVVEGVNHMSLYSNVDHLAKVGRVQAGWLKQLLSQHD